jgi:histidine triad (HIT) family protein
MECKDVRTDAPQAAEPGCPFCEIVAGRAPAEWILAPDYWPDAVAFVPLNPVTEGHALIVPKTHVPDFAADPDVFAATSRRAAELMRWTPRPMNVITSRGREATQSVFHLHLHLVPRAANDGLALPWYSGRSRRTGGEQR